MTLICIVYASFSYSPYGLYFLHTKYGVGFLFSLVSELAFGDACFLTKGKKSSRLFIINKLISEDLSAYKIKE